MGYGYVTDYRVRRFLVSNSGGTLLVGTQSVKLPPLPITTAIHIVWIAVAYRL